MIANILLIALIVIYFVSLPKLFEKAGEESWKGYVPGYNAWVWLKIMKKPWWWILLLFIPGVNFLMLMVMNVELGRSFNKRELKEVLSFVFIPWVAISQLALNAETVYSGPLEFKDKKKGTSREWFDSLLFAVIAATIIRTFFLEAYKIPTPSMEKNLLVGDFLFVSKMSYGPKLPNTPVTFPFTHNTLPIFNTKSYLEIFTLPNLRLPGFGSVERNDVVVFNFPAGDSVNLDNTNVTYYQMLNDEAFNRYLQQRKWDLNKDTLLVQDFSKELASFQQAVRSNYLLKKKLIKRPLDKKDNYIKRCVAVPGDIIEIKDRQLFVNGQPSGNTEEMQFNYFLRTGQPISPGANGDYSEFKKNFKQLYNVNSSDLYVLDPMQGLIYLPLSLEKRNALAAKFGESNIQVSNKEKGHYLDIRKMNDFGDVRYLPVFPNNSQYDWTEDNFGPLKIPAKGDKVKLDSFTLPIYRRIIGVYEGNQLEEKSDGIYINGQKTDSYTIQQDYYWLMGDNRQNSADSRFWGFVPMDHVVGKAVLVWFSTDPETGIRWNRVFKRIR